LLELAYLDGGNLWYGLDGRYALDLHVVSIAIASM
jgi:hypothetical protein